MSSQHEDGNAFGLYHSGAESIGCTQMDQTACLGGKRAGIQVQSFLPVFRESMANIIIDHVHAAASGVTLEIGRASEASGSGFDRNYLYLRGPDATIAGDYQKILTGESKYLMSYDKNYGVQITRDNYTDELTGKLRFDIATAYNNAISMSDVSNANRIAGISTYRGLFIANRGVKNITNVELANELLGTEQTSDGGQLPASGAGTITTTGTFADWPEAGWVQIFKADDTIREVVYYTSRTTTVLTVPAAGRAIFNTTASAGTNNDRLFPVSGICLAFELPSPIDTIQTIANETTAPAAVTFEHANTTLPNNTFYGGAIAPGLSWGVWIWREIPAGAIVSPKTEVKLQLKFDYDGVTYTRHIWGHFRIEDTSKIQYELYIGEGAEPDFASSPDATSNSLPFTHALAPAAVGTKEYRAVLLYRNEYNLASINRYSWPVTLDTSGEDQSNQPSEPTNIEVLNLQGGYVQVLAQYNSEEDANPADTWLIYERGDETDPDSAVDTPITSAITDTSFFGGPIKNLEYQAGPYGANAEMRYMVKVRRSTDSEDCDDTTVKSLIVTPPQSDTAIRRRAFYGMIDELQMSLPSVSRTVWVDQPNNIYFAVSSGKVEFWGDTTLIWVLRRDSMNPSNNGLWTTFSFVQELISGAPGDTPVEVAAWNGTKTIYLTANNVRRLEIDVTNKLIKCNALVQNPDYVVSYYSADIVYEMTWHTLLQIWDKRDWFYKTIASLNNYSDGGSGLTSYFALEMPWHQRNSTGDFE